MALETLKIESTSAWSAGHVHHLAEHFVTAADADWLLGIILVGYRSGWLILGFQHLFCLDGRCCVMPGNCFLQRRMCCLCVAV
jgi:hypothetical protein